MAMEDTHPHGAQAGNERSATAGSGMTEASRGRKRQRKRTLRYLETHALSYGVAPVERDDISGDVTVAICLFCQHFGREQRADRMRRATSIVKRFRDSFRPDQYLQHHRQQHPQQWARYLASSDSERRQFFSQRTTDGVATAESCFSPLSAATPVPVLTSTGRQSYVEVKPAIVELAAVLGAGSTATTVHALDHEGPYQLQELPVTQQSLCQARWSPPEGVFQSCRFVEDHKSEPRYRVGLHSRSQLDLCMRLAASGLSFRQISKTVAVFRTHTPSLLSDLVTNATTDVSTTRKKKQSQPVDNAGLTCNEEQTAEILRLGVAVSLGATSALLETCWAFALELRTTLQSTPLPYLDIRVKLHSRVDTAVHSVHLLAIPNYLDKCEVFMFQTLDRALLAVLPTWRRKLVGVATTGDVPISPRAELMLVRLQRELEAPRLYRSWGSGDQLHRILRSFYASIAGGDFFRALDTLRECIRNHPELLKGLHGDLPSREDAGSKHSTTQWLALGRETSWITDHLDVLWERLEKHRLELYRPTNSWVLALVVASWVGSRANDAFTTLVHPRATGSQQAQAISELAKDFGALFKTPAQVTGSVQAVENLTNGDVGSRLRNEQLATGKHNLRKFVTGVSAFASHVAKRMTTDAVDKVVNELVSEMASMVEELSALSNSLCLKDDHAAIHGNASSSAAKLTETLPPVLPHELARLSAPEFAELLQIRGLLPPQELQSIQKEHGTLRRALACDMALQQTLDHCDETTSFHEAWAVLDGRFKLLEIFAGGLASVLPCVSIVDKVTGCGDLALSAAEKGRDPALCTDFVLEAVLHAQQFQALITLQAKASRRG